MEPTQNIEFKLISGDTRKVKEVLNASVDFYSEWIRIVKEYYCDDESEGSMGTIIMKDEYLKFEFDIFKDSISTIELGTRYQGNNFDKIWWEVELYCKGNESYTCCFDKEEEALNLRAQILNWKFDK